MRPLLATPFRPDVGTPVKFTTLTLIASNLVPLAGVLFFGWSVFVVMVLFWFENLIIGFYNVLKMALAGNPVRGYPTASSVVSSVASKVFMIPFFIVHYGMFTLVHGVFVFALFGLRGLAGGGIGGGSSLEGSVFNMLQFIQDRLWLPAAALFVSHGVSFVVNYLMNGEWRRSGTKEIMGQPYGRIIVLHLAILLGGGVTMMLGSSTVALAVLVVLKICLDVASHVAEHKSRKPDRDFDGVGQGQPAVQE